MRASLYIFLSSSLHQIRAFLLKSEDSCSQYLENICKLSEVGPIRPNEFQTSMIMARVDNPAIEDIAKSSLMNRRHSAVSCTA